MLGLLLLVSGCVWKWPVYYPPVWSADGTKLTYAAARPDGKLAIWRIDLAAKDAAELAATGLAEPPVAMALSPQGDTVACVLVERRGAAPSLLRLHLLSPGSKGDRVVWEGPTERGIAELCWTPDGRAIALAADRPGGWTLWRVAADGSGAHPTQDGFREVRAPAASPDGRLVAFVARAEEKGLWSLCLAPLAGGERKLIAPAVFARYQAGYGPAWSPRGDAVAYVAERYLIEGFAEVWAWDAATGQRRRLAETLAGACLAPAWSPTGEALAFVRLPFGAGGDGPGTGGWPADIVVVDAAGKTPRPLVADGLANLMPAWSPDGRMLAFGTCAEPAAEPHVVRIVELESGTVRLAHDSPSARFVLNWAYCLDGNRAAFSKATGEIPQIRDPRTAAYAHRVLAERYAKEGNWSLASQHARDAAATGDEPSQARALWLLATARMRLGDPQGALAAAERIPAAGATEGATLKLLLKRGTQAVKEAEAELKTRPAAAPLHRLAEGYLQLGNPRKALECCFRLLAEFPDEPRLPKAAALVFACCAELGADGASHRVLERAAALIGEASLTRDQILLLAESAAANGQPAAALRWLDRLSAHAQTGAPVPQETVAEAGQRVARVCIRAGELFAASGTAQEALAAFQRGAQAPPGPAAAEASLHAGKALVEAGRHREATRCLLAALQREAEPATRRDALRLLTQGRMAQKDIPAYDAARVAELVTFGFLDSGVALGEQIMTGAPEGDPSRSDARRHLAAGFEKLVHCHLAKDNLSEARAVVSRWLRHASPQDDLPRALANLATCQRLAGERRALVETLSRLALEFPDRPEAAEARRQLLLLSTGGR